MFLVVNIHCRVAKVWAKKHALPFSAFCYVVKTFREESKALVLPSLKLMMPQSLYGYLKIPRGSETQDQECPGAQLRCQPR